MNTPPPLEPDEIGREGNPYLKRLDDLECFVSDAEDPIQFQRAFFMVLKPGSKGARMVPYEPYPYQIKLARDPAEQQIVNKSRQIGISVSTILDRLHPAITYDNYTCLFLSLRQKQANELIHKTRGIINSLQPGFKLKLVGDAKSALEFKNGSRFLAVSAADSSTRSYSSDLVLDEFAFVPNDEEILTAAMQSTVREGFKIRMVSTPFGDRGQFAKIVQACRKIADGSATLMDEKIGGNWSLHEIHHAECPDLLMDRIEARCTTEEMYLQEYCCRFLDETTSMISTETLMRTTNHKLKQWKLTYNPETGNRTYIGIDPGEKINDTGFTVTEFDAQKKKFLVRFVMNRKMNKDAQVEYTKEWVKLLHPSVVYVDATGAGSGTYQDLKRECPGFIEEVQLSSQMKEKLVYNMVGLFDSDRIELPDHEILRYQLHGLEREILPSGLSRYTGKKKTKGHDDLVWSTALALAYNMFNIRDVDVDVVSHNTRPARRRTYC